MIERARLWAYLLAQSASRVLITSSLMLWAVRFTLAIMAAGGWWPAGLMDLLDED